MTILRGSGNLLTQDVDALVNTVNTQGVMGKGIALQFKKAWPEMFKAYAAASRRGEIVPGKMHVWHTGLAIGPRFIINFPTKRHWRSPSRLEDIRAGLDDLVHVIREQRITSIALPPLGCGNGGLSWADVEPLIHDAMARVPATKAIVFAPGNVPAAKDQPNREPTPALSSLRAALLALIHEYQQLTLEGPTLIGVQKLAYFLQNAGATLRLDFGKNLYGPYADDLRKTLRTLEGHFITGFGDGSAPATSTEPIEVLPNAVQQVVAMEESDPSLSDQIQATLDSIAGFESPYGLELLATVHWVMNTDEDAQADRETARKRVREWSSRKTRLFADDHIDAAWKAVHERHLLTTSA